MIRRAFWLGMGAAAGIMGYRRVSALGRKVSGKVTGTNVSSTVSGTTVVGIGRRARWTARGTLGMARETIRFTRDVREGMQLYSARQNGPAASTLKTEVPEGPEVPEASEVPKTSRLSDASNAPESDQKDGR